MKTEAEKPQDVDVAPPVATETPQSGDKEIIDVIGIRPARNKNFVYAALDGQRIPVFAGKRFAKRLAGKKFKVSVTHDGAQTLYHYHP